MRWPAVPVLLCALLVSACGASQSVPEASPPPFEAKAAPSTPAPTPPLAGTLNVFAAQSLAESFAAIGKAFEERHPGVRVQLNLAGSSVLATQIEQAAPADVFASADLPQMERVASQRLAHEARLFARNAPVVVVPPDNPARIEDLRDLARPGVKVVLYADDVPIGRYARQVLANLGTQLGDPGYEGRVLANTVSRESNVRAALTKVEIGEADASIVYRTDASTNAAVRAIDIPTAANVVAEYPIAVLTAARDRALAQAFVAFVLGPEGQRILRDAGFEAPS
jgi:molybdate transport system substrate-binding protein